MNQLTENYKRFFKEDLGNDGDVLQPRDDASVEQLHQIFDQLNNELHQKFEGVLSSSTEIGKFTEKNNDIVADHEGAIEHRDTLEKYLKQIYNAYMYGDRNAGREGEIFK